MSTNLRYTLYKKLFISESDAASIRSSAIDIINSDGAHSVTNAYIEATLAYLDSKGLLGSIEALDADAGPRQAHIAECLKRKQG